MALMTFCIVNAQDGKDVVKFDEIFGKVGAFLVEKKLYQAAPSDLNYKIPHSWDALVLKMGNSNLKRVEISQAAGEETCDIVKSTYDAGLFEVITKQSKYVWVAEIRSIKSNSNNEIETYRKFIENSINLKIQKDKNNSNLYIIGSDAKQPWQKSLKIFIHNGCIYMFTLKEVANSPADVSDGMLENKNWFNNIRKN